MGRPPKSNKPEDLPEDKIRSFRVKGQEYQQHLFLLFTIYHSVATLFLTNQLAKKI